MNVLVYDDPPSVGALVRSALSGPGHRVSISSDEDEARLKLDTGLFDAVVIGPGGAPRRLAAHLEERWPELPIVLAGVPNEVPTIPPACAAVATAATAWRRPVAAVLRNPVSLSELRSAVRSVASRVESRVASALDADVLVEGRPLAFRIVGRAGSSLLLEARPGADVEVDVDSDSAVLIRRDGESPTHVSARLVFADAGRYLGVRVEDESLLGLWDDAVPAVTGPSGSSVPRRREGAPAPPVLRCGQKSPLRRARRSLGEGGKRLACRDGAA